LHGDRSFISYTRKQASQISSELFRRRVLPFKGLRAQLGRVAFSKTEGHYYCVMSLEGAKQLFVIVWARTRGLIELCHTSELSQHDTIPGARVLKVLHIRQQICLHQLCVVNY
jgi:hypothetical protein